VDAPRLRPLGIGEILDAAIKIYRSRYKTLMKAVFVVVAPVQLLTAVVRLSLPTSINMSATTTDPFGDTTRTTDIDAAALIGTVAALLIIAMIGLIASQLATATSLKVVSNAYLGEEEDWRASLRFATSRLPSLIWLTLRIGLLAFFGFLACVVPGVYLYFAWAVAVPVLLLEDKRGRHATRRSRQLVKGRWWPVFACVAIALLLASIVGGAFQGILVGVLASTDSELLIAVATAIAAIASAVLVTPFSAAVNGIVYFDLRVRKEGFDLELLARTLGVDPTPEALAWAADVPALGPGDEQPPFWPPPPGWKPQGG
jgi:hypothetical protein